MRPGDRIGRYVVVRELGRGAMGAVLVAHDPQLGREVALKLMLERQGDPALVERFRREAALAARLRHPGIVAVLDAAVDPSGRPFIVHELIQGESLQARLDRAGALAPLEAATVVRDLARALAHAHAAGVLHRDLKPANVLVAATDGRVVLADFGLARDAGQASALTRTGELLGTVDYMAPEQAGEGAGRVDERADVYALGAVLYALLTGAPPFRGASPMNVLHQVLTAPPAPPSRACPDVPPALEALCLRCLAKRPDERPASAEEVARELDRLLRAPAAPSRSRAAGPAVAAALLALVVGAVGLGAAALARRAPAPTPPAPPPPPVVTELAAPPTTSPPPPTERAPAAGWRWVRVTPTSAARPSARFAPAATFDARRSLTLVAGGYRDGVEPPILDDLWAWDGQGWRQLGRLPSLRYDAGLLAQGVRLYVLGGVGVTPEKDFATLDLGWTDEALREGWVFLGSPPPRRRHAFVAAPERGSFLSVGGVGPGGQLDELLEWRDDTGWRAQPPLPRPCFSAGVAWDGRRRRLVVFGGGRDDAFVGDLCVWRPDGGWSTRVDPAGPSARTEPAMLFDGERCLLFGGVVMRGAEKVYVDELWSLDGDTWRRLELDPAPPPRSRCAFVWDAAREVAVLFGGVGEGKRPLDDVWELHPAPP